MSGLPSPLKSPGASERGEALPAAAERLAGAGHEAAAAVAAVQQERAVGVPGQQVDAAVAAELGRHQRGERAPARADLLRAAGTKRPHRCRGRGAARRCRRRRGRRPRPSPLQSADATGAQHSSANDAATPTSALLPRTAARLQRLARVFDQYEADRLLEGLPAAGGEALALVEGAGAGLVARREEAACGGSPRPPRRVSAAVEQRGRDARCPTTAGARTAATGARCPARPGCGK